MHKSVPTGASHLPRSTEDEVRRAPGDTVDNAVSINARLSAAALPRMAPIVGEAVTAGHIKVVAARYDIATGQVEFLP